MSEKQMLRVAAAAIAKGDENTAASILKRLEETARSWVVRSKATEALYFISVGMLAAARGIL